MLLDNHPRTVYIRQKIVIRTQNVRTLKVKKNIKQEMNRLNSNVSVKLGGQIMEILSPTHTWSFMQTERKMREV